jgi:hypothetical protein
MIFLPLDIIFVLYSLADAKEKSREYVANATVSPCLPLLNDGGDV